MKNLMGKFFTWAFSVCLALTMFVAGAEAQTAPGFLPFQGYLADAAGKPVNGALSITFTLYNTDKPMGAANRLYQEAVPVVNVTQGYFSVYLGEKTPLDLSIFRTNPIVFVGVLVSGDTEEMKPLLQLATAPYAAFAQACGDATTLGGKTDKQYALASAIPGESQVDTWVGNNGYAQASAIPGESQVDTWVANNGYLTSETGDISAVNVALPLSGGSQPTGVVSVGLSGCPNANQILKWSGTAWECKADNDTTYTESQIDAWVGNNGYLTSEVGDISAVNVGVPGTGGSQPTGVASVGLMSCPNANQILKWNGNAWACAADNDTNSGGTLTTVNPSSAGGIVTSNSGNTATVGLTTSCSNGQVLKWNGSAWACAADVAPTHTHGLNQYYRFAFVGAFVDANCVGVDNNTIDCACDAGDLALTGGGQCYNASASISRPLFGGGEKGAHVWRFGCAGNIAVAFVSCLKLATAGN